MTKQEFLLALRKGISGLPETDIEERLAFYNEIIDDRMEEGISEEDAVAQIGNVNEIISQIIADTPLTKLVKEKIKPKQKLRVWEIILLVLGSPVWLPLLIAAFAVILSLYIVLWSLIVSLWSVFASVIGCILGSIIVAIRYFVCSNGLISTAFLGVGIVLLGLSIFLFYGCSAATKGIVLLTKKLAKTIKNCFIKKEIAQ